MLLLILYILLSSFSAFDTNPKILFIVSNAHFYGDSGIECTNHFEEIIFAYDEFINAGFEVSIASPMGGDIPIGYIHSSKPIIKRYLYDAKFMDRLEHTIKAEKVNPHEYAAIYFPGGGSAMFTVPENKEIQYIAAAIYENGGVVSTVCHGTAGIVDVKLSSGRYLVEGRNINGFPDKFENKQRPYFKTFPFSIQEQVSLRGGEFTFSEVGWDEYAIQDGRIVTGQDPTSARRVAEMVIAQIKNNH